MTYSIWSNFNSLPVVKKVTANTVSSSLVSVQPMNTNLTGNIFDFSFYYNIFEIKIKYSNGLFVETKEDDDSVFVVSSCNYSSSQIIKMMNENTANTIDNISLRNQIMIIMRTIKLRKIFKCV